MRRAVIGAALAFTACNDAPVPAAGTDDSGESASPMSNDDGSADVGADDTAASTGTIEAMCGDDLVTLGEQCDGDNLGGKTCATFGWEEAEGGLRCAADCSFDLTSCVLCGNGALDQPEEECDGQATTESSCASVDGFLDTPLGCTADCRLDYDACVSSCGNGELDPGEDCDAEGFFFCQELFGPGWTGDAVCSGCTLVLNECSLCGDGRAAGWELCDGSPFTQQGFELTCTTYLGFPSEGEFVCSDDCEADISDCSMCGDGFVDNLELCDGPSVFASCSDFGFAFGELACTADCQAYDGSDCNNCGNDVIDAGEDCDGAAVVVDTCDSLGFVGGKLGCAPDCSFDLSLCGSCGDGIAVGDESCDGEDVAGATCPEVFPGTQGGVVGCTPECEFEGTGCGFVAPGDVIISEILYAAAATPDTPVGQWLELHNPSALAWDLQNCSVHSNLPFEEFVLDDPHTIEPGDYLVLGTGGAGALFFAPDGALAAGYSLANTGDLVGLECNGLMIDSVIYDDGSPWPVVAPGVAIALDSAALDATLNDDGTSWCAASTAFGTATYGTPGAANDCL